MSIKLNGIRHSAAYFPVLFVPFICDCALLCRVLAFHPPSTPLKTRISILALPLTMHLPRFPLLVTYIVLSIKEGPGSIQYQRFYMRLRVVEGGLQLLINCYCSGFLLHKVSTATSEQAEADDLKLTFTARPTNTPMRTL